MALFLHLEVYQPSQDTMHHSHNLYFLVPALSVLQLLHVLPQVMLVVLVHAARAIVEATHLPLAVVLHVEETDEVGVTVTATQLRLVELLEQLEGLLILRHMCLDCHHHATLGLHDLDVPVTYVAPRIEEFHLREEGRLARLVF